MDTSFPVRMQFTAGGRLVAEVITSDADERRLIARYLNAKAMAGKPTGGVLTQRADLPRWFDVPVGRDVACHACGALRHLGEAHAASCSFDADYYEPRGCGV